MGVETRGGLNWLTFKLSGSLLSCRYLVLDSLYQVTFAATNGNISLTSTLKINVQYQNIERRILPVTNLLQFP